MTFSVAGVIGGLLLLTSVFPAPMKVLSSYGAAIAAYPPALNGEEFRNRAKQFGGGILTDASSLMTKPFERGVAIAGTAIGVGLAVRWLRGLKLPSARTPVMNIKVA